MLLVICISCRCTCIMLEDGIYTTDGFGQFLTRTQTWNILRELALLPKAHNTSTSSAFLFTTTILLSCVNKKMYHSKDKRKWYTWIAPVLVHGRKGFFFFDFWFLSIIGRRKKARFIILSNEVSWSADSIITIHADAGS